MILRVGGSGREELAGGRGNLAGGRPQESHSVMGHSILLSVRNTWAGLKSVHWQKRAHQETYDASLESTHTLWDQSPLLGWDTTANFTDPDNLKIIRQ